MTDTASIAPALATARAIRRNVEQVVVGVSEAVELLVTAVLADGHVLIEDVPGTGKTTLAKSLAQSMDCSFRRVQCTPDLLPSDITGFSVFDQRAGTFEFQPGPLFNQIVLVDEINRATPRTQSALLEAMAERQVTVESRTRSLPQPFLVLATQNPVELEGTFPLPEAQLDRFLLRIAVGYPAEPDEDLLLRRFGDDDPLTLLTPVATPQDVIAAQRAVRAVTVVDDVRHYLLGIVRATRTHPAVALGASPRASLALQRVAQAAALLAGREFVVPDDVRRVVPFVLAHRLFLNAPARLRGTTAGQVLAEIVDAVPVPVERDV